MRSSDWSSDVCSSDLRIRAQPPLLVITQGQNGARIHDRIEPMARAGKLLLLAAEDLTDAVAKAQHVLGNDGLMLLSPGAPSFPRYTDYTERRSEEHTSELQSLMRISYAVFCLKKKYRQDT